MQDAALEFATQAYRTLTPREAEVFRLSAEGLTGVKAAAAMGISRRTVEVHKRRIKSKLKLQAWTTAALILKNVTEVAVERPQSEAGKLSAEIAQLAAIMAVRAEHDDAQAARLKLLRDMVAVAARG